MQYLYILEFNPFFSAILFQHFLKGYKQACPLEVVYLVLPILYYGRARHSLVETGNPNIFLLARVGFGERYKAFKELGQHAIISACNQSFIRIVKSEIHLSKIPNTTVENEDVKKYIQAAEKLGKIFSKEEEFTSIFKKLKFDYSALL